MIQPPLPSQRQNANTAAETRELRRCVASVGGVSADGVETSLSRKDDVLPDYCNRTTGQLRFEFQLFPGRRASESVSEPEP